MSNDMIMQKGDLIKSLDIADKIINKKFISNIDAYKVKPINEQLGLKNISDIARICKIDQFALDKNENTRDKLISVFQAVSAMGASLIVIIHSTGNNIEYYMGVKHLDRSQLGVSFDMMAKSLSGNFPGVVFKTADKDSKIMRPISNEDMNELQKDIFDRCRLSRQSKKISAVTGIAGIRNEQNSEKSFIQGLEKVIDSMQNENYTLVVIADPLNNNDILGIKRNYENLYSAIMPFESNELTYGENTSISISEGISKTASVSINESISNSTTITNGTSHSHTDGSSDTETKTSGYTHGVGFGFIYNTSTSNAVSVNKSDTHSTNYSESKGETATKGVTISGSKTDSETNTTSDGTSKSIQVKFQNKTISKLLEKIDTHLERLDVAGDVGMWSVAAYAIADDEVVSKTLAASYQSVIRGEKSNIEHSSISTFKEENLNNATEYIKRFLHPLIEVDNLDVQCSSLVTSKELAIHAGFPEKSVSGFGVKNLASFGREVISEDKIFESIQLGKIYHMGREYENDVLLNQNNLTGHTFITGSTGSGKSNTIYQMLSELKKDDVKFLVVEPAKGEYKHVFGNLKDVSVYGTNPSLTPLLRINPFRFPQEIHILEHLDRLVEIFNVCWPMYAAMPAILKKAIENAYIDAGWDLISSTNSIDRNLLPSFKDIMNNVVDILNSSEYSDENKGNYKGALVTRLESLTTGIFSMIFSNNDLDDYGLFDKNVIVDLSRLGSMETKALIMGLLVMKLQEYRMSKSDINAKLKHVTVLEEAHNLLKRTSTEQSSESSNLLGKSVEMLANAIAEMRTYGEGFIIADQSPGLLDMSVIRNTNTKIIMRTPDFSDRELVGRAAGLSDDQIVDVAKLPKGVAVVYQNNWIEAVLCKVDKSCIREEKYSFSGLFIADGNNNISKARLVKILLSHFKDNTISIQAANSIKVDAMKLDLPVSIKMRICRLLDQKNRSYDLLSVSDIIAYLIVDDKRKYIGIKDKSIEEAELYIKDIVAKNIDNLPRHYQNIAFQCIINDLHETDANFVESWYKKIDNREKHDG
ncbi:ATP-binding protein [Campylobacter sputorum]|uniref:ATP-binding protein n=1 Tax=Campylobacter sputorum TaxID=206 RepID=UPI000B78FF89|nr:DUF87 domain-containing protein [Campylobacter sputorum]ASM37015.1 ATPase, AAA family [Campylobacter sputorum bv. faecalis CCUG 20703]